MNKQKFGLYIQKFCFYFMCVGNELFVRLYGSLCPTTPGLVPGIARCDAACGAVSRLSGCHNPPAVRCVGLNAGRTAPCRSRRAARRCRRLCPLHSL